MKQETPGFIANRLQAAVCAEAYSLISRGVISPEDLGELSPCPLDLSPNGFVDDVDKTMTSGLGLRWALTGPIVTNALGGGGNFRHFVDHIGSAFASWEGDMNRHKFDWSREKIDTLDGSVKDWIGTVDLKKVAKERDERLIGLIKDRAERS